MQGPYLCAQLVLSFNFQLFSVFFSVYIGNSFRILLLFATTNNINQGGEGKSTVFAQIFTLSAAGSSLLVLQDSSSFCCLSAPRPLIAILPG